MNHLFCFWFIVPIKDSSPRLGAMSEDNEWTGMRHLPTVTMHASTKAHAEQMADEILKHLPKGSTRTPLEPI